MHVRGSSSRGTLAPSCGNPAGAGSFCTVSVHKQASYFNFTPATALKDLSGFLLSFEVSGLRLEEGQAVGGLLCAVGKLKGHLFCTAEQIGELEAKYLGGQKDSGIYAEGMMTSRDRPG